VQLQIKTNKISELNALIQEKDRKLEKEMKRERKNRDISEKTNKDLINELNEIEETHKKEMLSLKTHFLNMVESVNYEKQNLVQELKEVRKCCNFIENNFLNNLKIISTNQISQSIKDIVFKIDSALTHKEDIPLYSTRSLSPIKAYK